MAARIIDGKAFAAKVRERVAAEAERLRETRGLVPGIAVVLVGENPASQSYVKAKSKQAAEAGLRAMDHRLAATASEAELLTLIARLNADKAVHGILVQLPLPKQIETSRILRAIDPAKDVDGFHVVNAGLLATGQAAEALIPCTPLGCQMLLEHHVGSLAGKDAVVIGRSNIVGRPMAQLLLQANATVTIVHSKTRDLKAHCRRADILVAAIGQPLFVKADMVREGATVIDVGINRVAGADGKSRIVGDVDFAGVSLVAGAITPVPGGVGPMTIACLLANTVRAAMRAEGLRAPDWSKPPAV
ncbi:MAG: bifunctional methylenetetrahydrofolate dehydrogenase/methenyltetrahydrofolate cyclohydrolase FolD [Hyphomicrobiaceae bacterium]|nr:MAG: bifunctional methylenetetrahydrofolate dehydrogenase/methenyltetrahydrofolate cyclohydrolase FolD [Hyphomicrobiaceae bacterium]